MTSAISIFLSTYQTRSHFFLITVQMLEIIARLCPMHILVKCSQTLIARHIMNGVNFQYGLLVIRITNLPQRLIVVAANFLCCQWVDNSRQWPKVVVYRL